MITIEKIFFVAVVIYLIVAVPLHYLNSMLVVECKEKCLSEEFDIIIRATQIDFNIIECYCLSSFTREAEIVLLEK